MRHTLLKSRWHTPRRQYSGDWRQNPWIHATDSSAQIGVEAPDELTQDRQRNAAIRVWEDEGGSIGTHGNVRR